ncbi:hypothetical protein RN001_001413 [Aquatica leii]|uniref:CHHC U11-48K-type domain-containing protein n=1 Tax=Aquatica leii TaxID=1421715 RepID=A0AAN7Q7U6_9COLE|nr:hypothetical protein RN001_001413 [Aquatica leii]
MLTIPSSWIFPNKKYILYPDEDKKKLIKQHSCPSDTWSKMKVKVHVENDMVMCPYNKFHFMLRHMLAKHLWRRRRQKEKRSGVPEKISEWEEAQKNRRP